MSVEVQQRALIYLQQHQVMTLATTGEEGVWAAAVFYANDGFDMFFLSAGHTRHAQNMAFSSQVAATIQEDYRDWTAVQGVQLEGEVQKLYGVESRDAIAQFKIKFPFLARTPKVFQAAFKRVNWYLLRPDRLYFVDNSRGFGHRDEIYLPVHRNR